MKIKFTYLFFTTVILLFLTLSSNAATQRCRLGKILAAQMSKRMMSVANWNKFAFPADYDSKVYAIVVIKLDKGRSLSIYDFSLKYGHNTFPCVAVRKGNGSFNANVWQLSKSNTGELYSMLFIVNIPGYSSSSKLNYIMSYNLSKSGMIKTELDFKNLYYSSFTSVNAIPKTGLLQGKK